MANKLDRRGRLERQLFSTNFMKVLGLFLKNPSARFYGGEVAKETGLSKAGANFALRDLHGAGLLTREPRGRLHFYSLASDNPLVRQLKVLSNTVGLGPVVEDLKKHSVKIVLYGSAATGDNTEESDVDLLVLTREKKEVEKRIGKYLLKKKIQPVIHTPQEWAALDAGNRVFVEQVSRGIVLWESDEAVFQDSD
jgi:predicted nucleotidyltransferase